jgi:hypothetical protein
MQLLLLLWRLVHLMAVVAVLVLMLLHRVLLPG